MFKRLREDVDSVIQRDPAARSPFEVVLTYPGIHAIIGYRLARWLWARGFETLAAIVSYLTRMVTGIEIHPAARIGRRLFIDHGMGIVIGGTAEIGDDVTLYQGVTLGGTSLLPGKRHPTLGNGVIVGANATILGPILIGANARVGANAVVLRAVPEGCTAVGVPARVIAPREGDQPAKFLPYGTPCGEEPPDPVQRALKGLVDEVVTLRHRLDRLEEGRTATPMMANGTSVSGRSGGAGDGGSAKERRHHPLTEDGGPTEREIA